MKLYVRWGDEWHYPNEFVRPHDGQVMEYFDNITRGIGSPDEQAIACWDFVASEVDYPLTLLGQSTDYHLLNAYPFSQGLFGTRYRVKYATEEFFQFPTEVLGHRQKNGRMVGDCDDSSILLASLIRNCLPPEKVKMVIGSSEGYENEADHAWVMAYIYGGWVLMETTLMTLPEDMLERARGIAGISGTGDRYLSFLEVNDVGYKVRIPFIIRKRDEVSKLRGISTLWGWPTKGVGRMPSPASQEQGIDT